MSAFMGMPVALEAPLLASFGFGRLGFGLGKDAPPVVVEGAFKLSDAATHRHIYLFADAGNEGLVVGHQNDPALEILDGICQCVDGIKIQVVCRFCSGPPIEESIQLASSSSLFFYSLTKKIVTI